MKTYFTMIYAFLIILILQTGSTKTEAQVQRNPVLEYCTGTWCQWCPCGHTIIRDQILPNIPNAIILSYHGPSNSSDPFRNFQGNQIIPALGFSGYPTGIIDRLSAPLSRSSWYPNMVGRSTVPAKVDIYLMKSYDVSTRELSVTAFAKSMEDLNGLYNISFVITEDRLEHPQTGNGSCPGASDYIHNHVVRGMINGHLGEQLSSGDTWRDGIWYMKDLSYTVPVNFQVNSMHFVAMVHKQNTPLNLGEIQQAIKRNLTENEPYPADALAFNSTVTSITDTLGAEIIFELEVTNNANLPLILDLARTENNLPASWNSQLCFADTCFDYLTDSISTTAEYGSSFLNPGETRMMFVKVYPEENAGTGTIKIQARNSFNEDEFSEITLEANGVESTTSVSGIEKPFEYSLGQNYPNPFNPSTSIVYSIPQSGHVSLKIYDMMGSEVAVLIDEHKGSGSYTIDFDASKLSSGVYIYKLISGNFSSAKKMTILK